MLIYGSQNNLDRWHRIVSNFQSLVIYLIETRSIKTKKNEFPQLCFVRYIYAMEWNKTNTQLLGRLIYHETCTPLCCEYRVHSNTELLESSKRIRENISASSLMWFPLIWVLWNMLNKTESDTTLAWWVGRGKPDGEDFKSAERINRIVNKYVTNSWCW